MARPLVRQSKVRAVRFDLENLDLRSNLGEVATLTMERLAGYVGFVADELADKTE